MGFLRKFLGQGDEEGPSWAPAEPDPEWDDFDVDDTNIDDAEIERRDRLFREWQERNEGHEKPIPCTACGLPTMRETAKQEGSSAADAVLPDGALEYFIHLPTVDESGIPVPEWVPDRGWNVPEMVITVAEFREYDLWRQSLEYGLDRPARQLTEIAQHLAQLERIGLARYDPQLRGWNWPIMCPTCISEIASGHRRPIARAGTRSTRSPIAPRLRFAVMQRDGFRCTYCGRTAADGATLHVDHVQPVAAGGIDDPDNLVTACSDCNLGKGIEEIV